MINIDNFIMEYSNFYSSDDCRELIHHFDELEKGGFTHKRSYTSTHKVKDKSVALQEVVGDQFNVFVSVHHSNKFLEKFWREGYEPYAEKYSVLKESSSHQVQALKLQKSVPGDGYHVWHYETSSKFNSDRLLTFILYLNDIDDGGETEFLYYPRRIKPEEGKLIIFPGTFTHAHRGNQPLSGTKYILTGWIFFEQSR